MCRAAMLSNILQDSTKCLSALGSSCGVLLKLSLLESRNAMAEGGREGRARAPGDGGLGDGGGPRKARLSPLLVSCLSSLGSWLWSAAEALVVLVRGQSRDDARRIEWKPRGSLLLGTPWAFHGISRRPRMRRRPAVPRNWADSPQLGYPAIARLRSAMGEGACSKLTRERLHRVGR